LLRVERDLVLVQAEAILTLEAVARGIGAPGRVCLNVVTGPYGALIGEWLAQAGAEVVELAVPLDRAVRPEEVERALAARPDCAVVAVVHAEAATGVVNPLAEIIGVARAHGALTIVDAVASAGAHAVDVEGLDLDICAFGPQKGLGGPPGVAPTAISDRAWEALRTAPAPWRSSSLSLLDWKERWLEPGRVAIPGTPSPLEMYALEAACERLAEETLEASFARHARAAAACRAGVVAMGLQPWVADPAEAVGICTTVRVPFGVDPAPLPSIARERFGVALLAGAGPLASQLVRIDHMGSGATPGAVRAALAALGGALDHVGASVDVGAGLEAAVA
ncbi:MAG TPA: aminotransferase class V-fold PLP-dependent enzyme, partial [Baekduia sp.]|nr:aminotransferase class V-fold PLP-dependent enzyme [Baekduia sp.]